MATAPTGSTATTNAIAQAGGSGQAFSNPGQTAYAFAVGAPDKAYATSLIGGADTVADALLGPRDRSSAPRSLAPTTRPTAGARATPTARPRPSISVITAICCSA